MAANSPAITIDFIVHIAHTAVFSPLPAALIPLTILAQGASPDSLYFRASLIYFVVICMVSVYRMVDRRVAYGRPRKMIWEEEVVLITGGAGGLGGLIAEVYSMRGISVAVLDIVPPTQQLVDEMQSKGVEYYQCDVSDASQLAETASKIEKDLGTVTILINNAAVANGKPLLEHSAGEIAQTYRVNVFSHYHTIQRFLPGMLARANGGTIVTVSSVLGYLGCAGLSTYTSSKAAVTAMHRSLVAELALLTSSSIYGTTTNAEKEGEKQGEISKIQGNGVGKVKTILVTPGQLTTSMFKNIKSPSNFLGPPVTPAFLAMRIIAAIDAGSSAEIAEPLYARWISYMEILPAGLKSVVRSLADLDGAAWRAYNNKATNKGQSFSQLRSSRKLD